MLEYAVVIWDPFTKSNIEKLERIQKKALRFTYNLYGHSSISELIKKDIFPPVTDRNRACRLKFLYQLVNGYYRINTTHILTPSTGYATRNRHSQAIMPLKQRVNSFKYSFFPRTINDWNNLSNEAVTQKSLVYYEERLF